jgi:methyl acetate hydrolase
MAIDKVLSKPIEAGLVPGVVAVAADDSGVIYEGAFGRRAVGSTEPMTLDSVFRIASMTKAITGTAAMQLVEKGRIGLEQPMGDVLPLVSWRASMEMARLDCVIPKRRSRSGTC